jgi:hypothetical protein
MIYLPILENTQTIKPTTTTTNKIPTATPALNMPSINSQLCKVRASAAKNASETLLKFSMTSMFLVLILLVMSGKSCLNTRNGGFSDRKKLKTL